MTVHLGPLSSSVDPTPPRNPQADGFGDNPRCHRRDISNYLSSRYARTQDIVSLISTSNDIDTFQTVMKSVNMSGGAGVHGAGHFTIAGDPRDDFYTSPNDPTFWVHHGMMDGTWAICQSEDPFTRTNVISGTTSMIGFGNTQTLDDVIDFWVSAPAIDERAGKTRELITIVNGPFCYRYE